MELGQKIRSKLKTDGIKVPELALMLGINEGKIYKWQKGHKPSDAEDFIKITNWLESVPRERKGGTDKNESMTYTQISATDQAAEMAHAAGQDGKPETLEDAVKAFLNFSEAINKQADVIVKLAGLINSK